MSFPLKFALIVLPLPLKLKKISSLPVVSKYPNWKDKALKSKLKPFTIPANFALVMSFNSSTSILCSDPLLSLPNLYALFEKSKYKPVLSKEDQSKVILLNIELL